MGLFGKKNKLVLHLTDEDMVRLMRIRSLYSYQLSEEVDDLFVITKAIQKEEAELDSRYKKVLNDPVKVYEEFRKPKIEKKDEKLVEVSSNSKSLDDTTDLDFGELPNYFARHESMYDDVTEETKEKNEEI